MTFLKEEESSDEVIERVVQKIKSHRTNKKERTALGWVAAGAECDFNARIKYTNPSHLPQIQWHPASKDMRLFF